MALEGLCILRRSDGTLLVLYSGMKMQKIMRVSVEGMDLKRYV